MGKFWNSFDESKPRKAQKLCFPWFFVAAMDYTKLLKESSGKTSKVGIVGATRGYAERLPGFLFSALSPGIAAGIHLEFPLKGFQIIGIIIETASHTGLHDGTAAPEHIAGDDQSFLHDVLIDG